MTDDVKRPLAAALLCATLLALLALLAHGVGPFQHLDTGLYERLSAHKHGAAGGWAETIAGLADPLPLLGMLAVACGIALLRGRPGLAAAAIGGVAGANLTTQALKHLLSHQKAQELIGAGGHLDSLAFPSGHATAAASIAIAFAFVVSRRWLLPTAALGALYALAVGCAVVVIAAHHPSDALGGYLVAAGWGFAVLSASRALAAPGPCEPEEAALSSPAALPSR
jgi:membrane-associated phospholipid phosphatase